MNYYILYGETAIGEYARPGSEIDSLEKGCRKSEFQFLDRTPLDCSISEYGGYEFPDLIIHQKCMPLISETMRQIMDRAGVDNLFYKRIILKDDLVDVREPYWLALPPRIDCLDMDNSIINDRTGDLGPAGKNLFNVFHIAIDQEKVGNYQIFRLPAAYENQEIIVTENLRNILTDMNLINVYFQKL